VGGGPFSAGFAGPVGVGAGGWVGAGEEADEGGAVVEELHADGDFGLERFGDGAAEDDFAFCWGSCSCGHFDVLDFD
jgi:hypothetical protein